MQFFYKLLQLSFFASPFALSIGILDWAKGCSRRTTRLKYAVVRWFWIISYALIADASAFLLVSIWPQIFNIPDENGKLPTHINLSLSHLLIIGFFSTLIIIALLHYLGVFRFNRSLKTYLVRPPLTLSLWLAPLFAFIALRSEIWWYGKTASSQYEHLTQPEHLLFGLFLFALCTMGPKITSKIWTWVITQPSTPPKAENKLREFNEWTDEEIRLWLETEEPNDGDKIVFGQKRELERIFSRFHQAGANPRGTHIAIEGPRGIGKSTLSKGLLCWLNKPPADPNINLVSGPWINVRIDAWGRDINSIEEQVLDRVVEELTQYTDTLALRGLPRQYSEAIKNIKGPMQIFGALLTHKRKTTDEFKTIQNTLELIDHNLLIIVEDPDRNHDPNAINRICSFFDRINSKQHFRINFVLNYSMGIESDEETQNKNKQLADLARLCEQKINLAGINSADIFSHLIKNRWIRNANEAGRTVPQLYYHPNKGVTNIIKTPRDFKQIARFVDRLWQPKVLMGEVDLLDLIGYCTITILAPNELPTLKEIAGFSRSAQFNSAKKESLGEVIYTNKIEHWEFLRNQQNSLPANQYNLTEKNAPITREIFFPGLDKPDAPYKATLQSILGLDYLTSHNRNRLEEAMSERVQEDSAKLDQPRLGRMMKFKTDLKSGAINATRTYIDYLLKNPSEIIAFEQYMNLDGYDGNRSETIDKEFPLALNFQNLKKEAFSAFSQALIDLDLSNLQYGREEVYWQSLHNIFNNLNISHTDRLGLAQTLLGLDFTKCRSILEMLSKIEIDMNPFKKQFLQLIKHNQPLLATQDIQSTIKLLEALYLTSEDHNEIFKAVELYLTEEDSTLKLAKLNEYDLEVLRALLQMQSYEKQSSLADTPLIKKISAIFGQSAKKLNPPYDS